VRKARAARAKAARAESDQASDVASETSESD